MTAIEYKLCPRCNTKKSVLEFIVVKNKYRYSYCRSCVSLKQKEYYKKNVEKIKARVQLRREEKSELVKKEKRKTYEKFKLSDRYKEYRKRNRQTRRSTIHGKLHDNFSCLIRNSLNNKGGVTWCALVGYTTAELKIHLETQFQSGMSWDNYGEWHIDHIAPVCSFGYQSYDSQEFKTCWSLNNLRPLWSTENIQKGAKDKKLSVRSSVTELSSC